MKYELSIDASYLDDDRWNVAAGIREFLQNGRDAEIEQSAPLKVTHRGQKLAVENEGAVLSRDALLLGRSTKRDRQDVLAGKWGEGLKLGALALVRAGYKVVIRNGSEVWTPAIEASEKFAGRDVLTFDVKTGRQERNRVRVEIDGISADDWKALKEHFLFLRKGVGDTVDTAKGTLLLGAKQKGCVYVKGILVQRHPDLEFGYNLKDAELDRDRRMVDHWDLKFRMRDIWFEATATRPDLIKRFSEMLEGGAVDTDGVDAWGVSGLPEAARNQIASEFKARHGDDAVPVPSLADSKDIEHLGKQGIVVKKQLQAVLESVTGSFSDLKESLAKESVREYGWHELDVDERKNIESALGLLNDVGVDIDLVGVTIADFRSENLLGQYNPADDRITLARKLLTDRAETLRVFVHEVSHRNGGDGDKGHVHQIEVIWSKIAEHLRAIIVG